MICAPFHNRLSSGTRTDSITLPSPCQVSKSPFSLWFRNLCTVSQSTVYRHEGGFYHHPSPLSSRPIAVFTLDSTSWLHWPSSLLFRGYGLSPAGLTSISQSLWLSSKRCYKFLNKFSKQRLGIGVKPPIQRPTAPHFVQPADRG